VLKALNSFDENTIIGSPDEIAPLSEGKSISEISVTFNLSPDDITEIYSLANITAPIPKSNTIIEVCKKSDNNKYEVISWGGLKFSNIPSWDNVLSEIKTILEGADLTNLAIDLDSQDTAKIKAIVDLVLSKGGRPIINPQTGVSQNIVAISESLKTKLEKTQELMDQYLNNIPEEERFLDKFIESKLPYFIMFSSFDNPFPDEISLEELPNNEWAKDLEQVSNFKISEISNPNKQTQSNHQSKVNTDFTDQFKKYWTQDNIQLEVEKDDGKIYFWISENGRKYKPSQRSQGQQWYLSFYITVIARLSEDRPNVILIDEPGLYLHAKAQKDLLKVLDDQNFYYPVVFSTHSPYLITEKKLGDIRLVEKNDEQTTIVGKIWAKVSDGETLTPILTAIGLGINDSITDRDKINNIVAEGMEEVFYLRAFYKIIDKTEEINVINGGGTNMGKIGSIIEGWGGNVIYLLDNDAGGKSNSKELKKWDVPEESIVFVSDNNNESTADIFSANDFAKHIINDNKVKIIKNSQYIVDNKLEKVLLARKFLEKVNAGTVILSKKSTDNINKLLDKIKFN